MHLSLACKLVHACLDMQPILHASDCKEVLHCRQSVPVWSCTVHMQNVCYNIGGGGDSPVEMMKFIGADGRAGHGWGAGCRSGQARNRDPADHARHQAYRPGTLNILLPVARSEIADNPFPPVFGRYLQGLHAVN